MANKTNYELPITHFQALDKQQGQVLSLGAFENRAWCQYYLGLCYHFGTPWLAQNHKMAVLWWYQAARQGLGLALNRLGGCYQFGWGVTVSLPKACRLYQMALKQNSLISRQNLAYLETHNSQATEGLGRSTRRAPVDGPKTRQGQLGVFRAFVDLDRLGDCLPLYRIRTRQSLQRDVGRLKSQAFKTSSSGAY